MNTMNELIRRKLIRCGTDQRYVTGEQLSCLSCLTRAQLNFQKAPVLRNPYTAILEKITGDGKLEMERWHTCETTHCLGGWTVCLTPGGRELEQRFDTATAARIILIASRPDAPLPNFRASNQAAMAFIKARSAEETCQPEQNK